MWRCPLPNSLRQVDVAATVTVSRPSNRPQGLLPGLFSAYDENIIVMAAQRALAAARLFRVSTIFRWFCRTTASKQSRKPGEDDGVAECTSLTQINFATRMTRSAP